MTKEEFNRKLYTELTPEENALINFNVYYNPKYIKYYTDYHSGKYDTCYEFLMDNRSLLTLENTPPERKKIAKAVIKMAKQIYGNKSGISRISI